MAKQLKDINNIDVEIKKLEDKVNEFQKYLSLNSIVRYGDLRIDEKEFNIALQESLHKEIGIQIKMQDALFSWLPLLKKLKEETATQTGELRGGQEANGLFNKDKK